MVLKIGLDFHGVISAQPDKFAIFCKKIRQLGVAVYVISGGPKSDIIKYLDRYGIEYDQVWAILDDCEKNGTVSFYDDGSFQVPTEIWDKAKAEYCAKEGIDFHVDDSAIYGRYFVTPYCHYDIKQGCCRLNNRVEINFNSPKAAAVKIAEFLQKSCSD